MRRKQLDSQNDPKRSSGSYVPSDKEEYLSAAIQADRYSLLRPVPEDMDGIQELLSKDGVVLIKNAIPGYLIDEFLKTIPGLIGNHELLAGLVDHKLYDVPPELSRTLNLKKILKKNESLSKLLVFVDNKMKLLFDSSIPISEETFLRCKGTSCSTIEHCDFYHYKSKIFAESTEKKTIAKCARDCGILLMKDPMECPCGVWAHKSCYPEPYFLGPDKVWTCFDCSNKEYPIYTAWINLSDIAIDSSVLGVIKESHSLQGFEVPFKCREVTRSKVFILICRFLVPVTFVKKNGPFLLTKTCH